MAYRIREIEKSDNKQIEAVIKSTLAEYGGIGPGFASSDPETTKMFQAYQKDRSKYWVVAHGDVIAGGAGFSQLKGAGKKVCELQKMYFLKKIRGRGFAPKLLAMCIDEARNAGYKTMYLETLESMDKARSIYKRFGFKAIDKPLGKTGHSGCNYWMTKDL